MRTAPATRVRILPALPKRSPTSAGAPASRSPPSTRTGRLVPPAKRAGNATPSGLTSPRGTVSPKKSQKSVGQNASVKAAPRRKAPPAPAPGATRRSRSDSRVPRPPRSRTAPTSPRPMRMRMGPSPRREEAVDHDLAEQERRRFAARDAPPSLAGQVDHRGGVRAELAGRDRPDEPEEKRTGQRQVDARREISERHGDERARATKQEVPVSREFHQASRLVAVGDARARRALRGRRR